MNETQQLNEQNFKNYLNKFLSSYSSALNFDSKNEINKARVNTSETLKGSTICALLDLSEQMNLNLTIKRSGAGLKIEFLPIK